MIHSSVQIRLSAASILLIGDAADASMLSHTRSTNGHSSMSRCMAGSEPQHAFAFRKPVRITITLPLSTFEQLQQRSDQEGRSMSNLSAYLIEGALSRFNG
jgi:hypothetical protein